MKKIRNFILIVVSFSFLIILINMLVGHNLDWENLKRILLFTFFYTAGNYFGIILFLRVLDKLFIKSGQEKIRLILRIVFSFIISVMVTCLINLLLFVIIGEKPLSEMGKPQNFVFSYLIPILFSVIVTLIYFISEFYKEIYERKNKRQELVIQKISSQYEDLQQQLSPHFLFNSLNVLDALIDENPETAHKFNEELSNVYRYVLEQQSNNLVTIEEELEFVGNYVNLMCKRFEGMVDFFISDTIDEKNKVFPMSIQLLIENAFKHNTLSETNPLKIEIYQDEKKLIIKNNLAPKEILQSTTKKGLANIKTRYQNLGLILEIEKNEKYFEVHLPIINKNYIIMEHTMDHRELAEKRVKKLKKYYKTLSSCITAVLICTIINLVTSWDYIFVGNEIRLRFFWAIWVIIPCGIVILGKTISLFWLPDSKYDWEEKKIQEFLQEKQSKL